MAFSVAVNSSGDYRSAYFSTTTIFKKVQFTYIGGSCYMTQDGVGQSCGIGTYDLNYSSSLTIQGSHSMGRDTSVSGYLFF